MPKRCLFTILVLLLSLLTPQQAFAIEDPRSLPNNKVGIHILFPTELQKAAELVNNNGGDWGYVIIPIQSGDKDIEKWQNFMDTARQYRITPILRLATQGDYFNTHVWKKPVPSDILDFANFLNSLEWPTKNRYVVVFNEVNRGDEWGGSANASEYTDLLSFAVTVFKSKHPDFFMISAGLDNAAPNQGDQYINQYSYMRQMQAAVPGIFNQVDGIASHSYPNPAFSQPPNTTSPTGTGSFIFEKQLIREFTNKDLPVFITETGWSSETLSDEVRANYIQQAFETIWNDNNVVAVTPFLLQGMGGPFQKFSFLNADGSSTKQFERLQGLRKIKGSPTLTVRVLSATTAKDGSNLPAKKFDKTSKEDDKMSRSNVFMNFLRWIFRLDA